MNANNLRDLYRTLDLEPGATLDDLKRSYRELVKVWHPDRFAHDPALERKGQEKLKQINSAFDLLQEFLTKEEPAAKPASEKPKPEAPSAEEFFLQAQKLFFGNCVVKDAIKAMRFFHQSAELGYAPAQNLLGVVYYSGDGIPKSTKDAAFWWTKAAKQFHAGAQYSLGCLYKQGHQSGFLAKVVKSTVDWQIGDTKIEAYKWLNLAITYGFGKKAGIVKQSMSIELTEKQRNEARSRAASLYPKYPTVSSEEIFDQLFEWFLQEGNSPTHAEMQKLFSKIQTQTGGLTKLKPEIRERGLEHLKNTFLGDTLSKTGGFFKAVGSNWSLNRSSDDWGRLVGRNIVEYPYDYLSDTFIQRRENAINHIWLNLMSQRS